MMNFFMITTASLKDRIWFRDSEDFRVAMNYVAIVAFTMNVNVLAFILMSNHVHFVIECDPLQAKAFIDRFKMLYSTWLRKKYGSVEFLRRVGVDISPVVVLTSHRSTLLDLTAISCLSPMSRYSLSRGFSAPPKDICTSSTIHRKPASILRRALHLLLKTRY